MKKKPIDKEIEQKEKELKALKAKRDADTKAEQEAMQKSPVLKPGQTVQTLPCFLVEWYEHEYEAGWGATDRDDGLSLYLTEELAKKDIQEHKIGNTKNTARSNDGYYCGTHPCHDKPKQVAITNPTIIKKLQKEGKIRFFHGEEPKGQIIGA